MRCPRVRPRSQAEPPGGDGAPLAGTRTCRQELADRRGWSTFSKAWPVRRNDTAVARREAPACFERDMRLRLPMTRLIGAPHPRHSCRGRTPRAPVGRGRTPRAPVGRGPKGKAGSPGAVQTIRAITHGCLKIEYVRGRHRGLAHSRRAAQGDGETKWPGFRPAIVFANLRMVLRRRGLRLHFGGVVV